jgi:hypothetical protein
MDMKDYVKLIGGIAGLIGVTCALLGADATTASTGYATKLPVPLNSSATNSITASTSNAVMLALNAQALLLKELIQDHQKKAADLTKKNESEKAKWETDLVNELQEKNSRIQAGINQGGQSWQGTNGSKAASSSDTDDQLVFVSTVDFHLEQVRQELLAAFEESRVLITQLATNKAPEEFGGMSFVLGENQRLVKELQREERNLELRKLEFRALLKVMQK